MSVATKLLKQMKLLIKILEIFKLVTEARVCGFLIIT